MSVFDKVAMALRGMAEHVSAGAVMGLARDKTRALMLDAQVMGVDPSVAVTAYWRAMELASASASRTISEALANGDDPLVAIRHGSTGSQEDAVASLLTRLNRDELSVTQCRYLLGRLGLSPLDVRVLTRRDECIIVWLDGDDGPQIEAPETMSMAEAQGALREASSIKYQTN